MTTIFLRKHPIILAIEFQGIPISALNFNIRVVHLLIINCLYKHFSHVPHFSLRKHHTNLLSCKVQFKKFKQNGAVDSKLSLQPIQSQVFYRIVSVSFLYDLSVSFTVSPEIFILLVPLSFS